jgi:hypothetical protein
MPNGMYARGIASRGCTVLNEKGSNGLLMAVIVLATAGLLFGWGPLKGLHGHWTGEAKKPVITEAESHWKASREEAQRKAKEAEEQAKRDDQTTLTMGNFEAKLRDQLKGTYYTLSRINCVADSFNISGTQCAYQFNIGKNGATFFVRNGPGSRKLTSVGFMVGNPHMFREPVRSELAHFYALLADHVAGMVAPELPAEMRKNLLRKLKSGVGPDQNEARIAVGEWEYLGESGLLDWAFYADRKGPK